MLNRDAHFGRPPIGRGIRPSYHVTTADITTPAVRDVGPSPPAGRSVRSGPTGAGPGPEGFRINVVSQRKETPGAPLLTIALSLSLLLAPAAAGPLLAQDEKKTDPKKPDDPTKDAGKDEKKDDAKTEKKAEAKPAAAKDASQAGRAAEPAAADDPARGPGQARRRPQGRRRGDRRGRGRRPGRDLDRPAADPRHPDHRPANDVAALKGVTKDNPEAGVSPEVFGAWFTGFGKPMDGITPETERPDRPALQAAWPTIIAAAPP